MSFLKIWTNDVSVCVCARVCARAESSLLFRQGVMHQFFKFEGKQDEYQDAVGHALSSFEALFFVGAL
jgi:hypothetical protein